MAEDLKVMELTLLPATIRGSVDSSQRTKRGLAPPKGSNSLPPRTDGLAHVYIGEKWQADYASAGGTELREDILHLIEESAIDALLNGCSLNRCQFLKELSLIV